jgi:hypothetical protein
MNFERGVTYEESLAARVMTAASESLTFLDICRRCAGAFPSDIWRHLRANLRDLPLEAAPASSAMWLPELSPTRAEWYYAPNTVEYLLGLLDGPTLLVGAPTLAYAAHATLDVLLVDTSPWISLRLELGSVPRSDVPFEALSLDHRFATVLLDPPWYFPTVTDWLTKALAYTDAGGRVLVSVPGELTRPSAVLDQQTVIDAARPFGHVTVERGVLEYDTPLFELEALKAAGLPLTGRWRLGDLIVVERNDQRMAPPPNTAPSGDVFGWLEFEAYGQIISVRSLPRERSDGAQLLREVPGVHGKVLDTVSRRDSRLSGVDLWTSRNRVAATSDVAKVVDSLSDPTSPTAREILEWLEVE